MLLSASERFDFTAYTRRRLLAAKADIREELDQACRLT